jgi:hypothetical protein
MRAAPCARAPRVGVKNGIAAILLIVMSLALAHAAEKKYAPKSTGHLKVASPKNLRAFAGAYSTSIKTPINHVVNHHLISLAKEAGQHDVGEVMAASLTKQNELKNCGVTSRKTDD